MRATSVTLLALAIVPSSGCSPDRPVATVHPEQAKIETKEVPGVPNKDIDILFVVDDSGSMKEEQDSLRQNFSRFIGILDSIPGGRPNVQIGVITPNLGTTAIDGSSAPTLGACTQSGGERGELRALGAGGPRFLRDVATAGGGRSTNFTGTLADAVSQLATVGNAGCGIEQHLEATKRALDNNPANAGFVRENAYLAVIVIADEDDCSLAKSSLFDAAPGDVINFRCTTEGVACDTPDAPFDTAAGRRTDCHPKFDSTVIAPVDRYVDFLKGKKRDPRDVIVAGILGDPEPFDIVAKPGTTQMLLGRSCTYNGPSGEQFAFPAVRTADFLAQFTNHARTTICDADLSDGLEQIAVLLRRTIIDACFEYTLSDADPRTEGVQYDCSVTEVRRHANAPDEELRVLPPCGGSVPCWRIEEDPLECDYT
ncbi:MAG TPA: hypothetical protein VFO79_03440, partial [Xanthomonadales bacterium]|nr:hypothetical protein [Xanthomonadales bacterium]